ncbi:hypothetical protein SBV1_820015 [Verrucomicrobia bacterium]|nr:hypothetical protein SBV1_820015 [Verrucomicrobiota bacterium]
MLPVEAGRQKLAPTDVGGYGGSDGNKMIGRIVSLLPSALGAGGDMLKTNN